MMVRKYTSENLQSTKSDKIEQAEEYNYFVVDGCLWCNHCRKPYALVYRQLKPDLKTVYFHFECKFCFENSTFSLNVNQLAYLILRMKYKQKDDKQSWIYSLLRCFKIAINYPHFIKGKQDQEKFEVVCEKIGKIISDKKKIKRAIKYHNRGWA